MSTIVMSKVWPLQMPQAAKSVLVSLADNANDEGACWPSIATICMRTCLSERAVQNALKWLQAHKAISRDERAGRSTMVTVTPDSYVAEVAAQPPQEMHPRTTCAPQEVRPPPQEMHPTPARRAPRTVKEPSKNHRRAQITLPEWLPAEKWEDFREHRAAMKAPLTPQGEKLNLATLGKLRERGYSPTAIVDATIENGWKGFFAPKHGAAPAAARKEFI